MGSTARAWLGVVIAVVAAAGCGGGGGASGDGGSGNADPRCVSLCQIDEPSVEGAYDICSAESAALCIEECEARISDATSICASCLLENAYFGTGPRGTEDCRFAAACGGGTECTVRGAVTCSYCSEDTASEESCLRMAYPRREVRCTPRFRPVAECAALCGGG